MANDNKEALREALELLTQAENPLLINHIIGLIDQLLDLHSSAKGREVFLIKGDIAEDLDLTPLEKKKLITAVLKAPEFIRFIDQDTNRDELTVLASMLRVADTEAGEQKTQWFILSRGFRDIADFLSTTLYTAENHGGESLLGYLPLEPNNIRKQGVSGTIIDIWNAVKELTKEPLKVSNTTERENQLNQLLTWLGEIKNQLEAFKLEIDGNTFQTYHPMTQKVKIDEYIKEVLNPIIEYFTSSGISRAK